MPRCANCYSIAYLIGEGDAALAAASIPQQPDERAATCDSGTDTTAADTRPNKLSSLLGMVAPARESKEDPVARAFGLVRIHMRSRGRGCVRFDTP